MNEAEVEVKNKGLLAAIGDIEAVCLAARHEQPDDDEKCLAHLQSALRKIASTVVGALGDRALPSVGAEHRAARPLKVPVINMPGRAALAYKGAEADMPRLAALIEVDNPGDGKPVSSVGVYIGKELLADMTIYRGKCYAVKMVRGALKGAMSRLGKHRRMTANRQSREAAAAKEGK